MFLYLGRKIKTKLKSIMTTKTFLERRSLLTYVNKISIILVTLVSIKENEATINVIKGISKE